MPKMAPKNIAMLVAVAVIFVTALVLVIVGVATHEEPGLMNPSLRWSHMPLSIGCEGYVPSREDDCEVAVRTVATINRRLGFTAFRFDDSDRHDVTITIGVPAEQGWMDPGGDAELSNVDGGYVECRVRTANTGTTEMLSLVLHHELGHCLGLDHDDYEQSIMRPIQTPTPDRTIPPWISDYDRGLLRDLYLN